MKKTKGNSKGTAKKPTAKRTVSKTKKPVNLAQVREKITNLVGASADAITKEVIEVAKKGALASAKYLFEVAGLYPATEASGAKPEEDSLAHMLMNRLGGWPGPEGAREEAEEELPEGKPAAAEEIAKVNTAPKDGADGDESTESGE